MRQYCVGFWVIIVLLFVSVSSSVAQEAVIQGRLVTKERAVEYAYLINMRSKKSVISQREGSFALNVMNGDTLFFRCLGYKDTTFYVNPVMLAKDSVILRIKSLDYALKEVKIRGFMSYAMFKQAFASVKLDDKDKPIKFKVDIDYLDLAVKKSFAPGASGSGMSFSMGGNSLKRDEEKVKALSEKEARMERYDRVTSHENLQVFTGLKGSTLDSFVVFLRTQYKINPLSSEYEMLTSVKLAYSDFLAMTTLPKDTISIE